mgnify:CR=1 FL=1
MAVFRREGQEAVGYLLFKISNAWSYAITMLVTFWVIS